MLSQQVRYGDKPKREGLLCALNSAFLVQNEVMVSYNIPVKLKNGFTWLFNDSSSVSNLNNRFVFYLKHRTKNLQFLGVLVLKCTVFSHFRSKHWQFFVDYPPRTRG
jgi:hypothetical protein